jgi:hypothetical protein
MPLSPNLRREWFAGTGLCWMLVVSLISTGNGSAQEQPAKVAAKKWFKGNLHTHSLWSDGNEFPEVIADRYKSHGYHFLALSDHNILSKGEKWISVELPVKRENAGAFDRYLQQYGKSWVETRENDGQKEVRLKGLDEFRGRFEKAGEFLMIQAEEITDRFNSLPVHINASNLVELIRPQGGSSVRDTIANNLIAIEQQSQRAGRPILGHVNHPNFGYAVTAEDLAAVVQERVFEIYNGHPGVNQLGDAQHADLERIWDIANTIRIANMKQPPLLGLATDDSHNYYGPRGASPGRGWVMVHTTELTPESLITAIQAAEFYASSGVVLESVQFNRDASELSLVIHPESGVEYTTQFVGTPREFDRASEPVRDKEGKEIVATRRYSADVGQVFAEVKGPRPSYRLTGKELYVRAVVNSSKPHPNPSLDKQKEQAWTQPVGWQRHLPNSKP